MTDEEMTAELQGLRAQTDAEGLPLALRARLVQDVQREGPARFWHSTLSHRARRALAGAAVLLLALLAVLGWMEARLQRIRAEEASRAFNVWEGR
jgi:hypothetical protein